MCKQKYFGIIVVIISVILSYYVGISCRPFFTKNIDSEPASLAEIVEEPESLDEYPRWSINESGQTYGPNVYSGVMPDLISAVSDLGIRGYIYKEDFFNNELSNEDLLLYASDGKTVVGKFRN